MDALLGRFGCCVLPAGLRLWTERDSDDPPPQTVSHEMFFRLDPHECNSGSYGDEAYTCKLAEDVVAIAPFSMINYGSCKSVTLFSEFNDDLVYVNNVQMQSSFENRKHFIAECSQEDIEGWVSPVQTSIYDIELALFRPQAKIDASSWRLYTAKVKDTSTYGRKIRCRPPANYPVSRQKLISMKLANEAYSGALDVIWTPFDHYLEAQSRANSSCCPIEQQKRAPLRS
jgi:hypothetical protein